MRRAPGRYGFRVSANSATVLIPDEPTTYRQATSGDDLWQAAMDDEIQSLKENGTWEEVDPPAGRRIVDSKWV